ncbi:MAG: hypothetical protein ACR2G2_08365 [Pseudonocardia sp.]
MPPARSAGGVHHPPDATHAGHDQHFLPKGATIGGTESFETLQLWLATVCPGFGKLRADADQRSVSLG